MCSTVGWYETPELGIRASTRMRLARATPDCCSTQFKTAFHPGGNPGANLEAISHRYFLRQVAFEWELTSKTVYSPLGCLLGGVQICSNFRSFDHVPRIQSVRNVTNLVQPLLQPLVNRMRQHCRVAPRGHATSNPPKLISGLGACDIHSLGPYLAQCIN